MEGTTLGSGVALPAGVALEAGVLEADAVGCADAVVSGFTSFFDVTVTFTDNFCVFFPILIFAVTFADPALIPLMVKAVLPFFFTVAIFFLFVDTVNFLIFFAFTFLILTLLELPCAIVTFYALSFGFLAASTSDA